MCAYLFGVSYTPRELNSNMFLDRSNCFVSLQKKQSTCFGSTMEESLNMRTGNEEQRQMLSISRDSTWPFHERGFVMVMS